MPLVAGEFPPASSRSNSVGELEGAQIERFEIELSISIRRFSAVMIPGLRDKKLCRATWLEILGHPR